MNNSITVVGHVGNPPKSYEFKDTNNKVAKFSVAVKEYTSKGEQKTMWLDVDAWNGLADRVLKTVTKGREVVVTGRLAIASFEQQKDGVKNNVTKPVIKLTSFHLCGKKPESASAQSEEQMEAIN